MRKLSLFLTLVLSFGTAHATVQRPDTLILEGKEVSFCSYPLQEYFATYPEKRPKSGGVSSALWRGYVATISITEGLMSVTDIAIYESFLDEKFLSVIDEVFPESDDRVMTWFSGNIDILETIEPDNSAAGPIVTHRKTLQISSGLLVHTTTVWTKVHDEDTRYFCTMGA